MAWALGLRLGRKGTAAVLQEYPGPSSALNRIPRLPSIECQVFMSQRPRPDVNINIYVIFIAEKPINSDAMQDDTRVRSENEFTRQIKIAVNVDMLLRDEA